MKDLLYKSSLLLLLMIFITGCSGGDNSLDTTAAASNLTISIDGPGTGTVISSPAGINCGTDCSESYTENTVVTLTASPSSGSSFSGWSGACSGTDSCSVTMDAAKSVTATFSVAAFNLTVSIDGPGTGTVTSSPAGVDCGTDCAESYTENTVVNLTASPATGSSFIGWSGACSGTSSCSVTMDAAKSVTATFSATTFNLIVSIDGAGTGTVTSSPAGIDCGTDCSESYTENTIVTLTASRATGSSFAGWSGACSGTSSCSVTMDAEKSVTATFVEYSVDCSSYAIYSPGIDPITQSSGAATTTVIVMHGKAGMPDDIYLVPLYTELSNAGYDVIAPYMPWSGLVWDGPMCESMNYIDSLAAQEAGKGNNVIIAGHSMGGAHALIYAATSPPQEVKALITLAPGHFPHLELPLLTVFDPVTAAMITSSIAKAETMVANGNGDVMDTFDTLIPDLNNPLLQISATANDYLSYHALDQYPEIDDVLPTIKLPVLWLAGADDPLTDFYDMAALFNRIASQSSIYKDDVIGDHLGMVSNSAVPIDVWLISLEF